MKIFITLKAIEILDDPVAGPTAEKAVREAVRIALGEPKESGNPERNKTTWYAYNCPLALHCRINQGIVLTFTRSHSGMPFMPDELFDELLPHCLEIPVA